MPDFLKSSNFWTAVMLAAGGLFVGFPEDAATTIVSQLFALFGTGKLLHEYVKTRPQADYRGAVNRSNWWNYIAVIFTAVLPTIPGGFTDGLEALFKALLSSNWQGVLIALFSLATILYNLFQSKNKVPPAAMAVK